MAVIVWFKRDLRLRDHAPLASAIESQELIIPLYLVEPELWHQPDSSFRHWAFIHDCLVELNQDLQEYDANLIIRMGEAIDVLENLYQNHPITALFSHEETGNYWTYQRDIAVAKWCKSKNIFWHEFPSNGVVRRLKNRDDWTTYHKKRMGLPSLPIPENIPAYQSINSDPLPDKSGELFGFSPIGEVQAGGRSQGKEILDSFLNSRSARYLETLSKPGISEEYCSRLSTHITYGTLSIREIFHACWKQLASFKKEITKLPKDSEEIKQKKKLRQGISAMLSRLHWHCHFIQKLENQPSIEFVCMHPAFEGMREPDHDQHRLMS